MFHGCVGLQALGVLCCWLLLTDLSYLCRFVKEFDDFTRFWGWSVVLFMFVFASRMDLGVSYVRWSRGVCRTPGKFPVQMARLYEFKMNPDLDNKI